MPLENEVFEKSAAWMNALRLKILLTGEVRAGTEWRFLKHPGHGNRLFLMFDGEGYVGSTRQRVAFGRERIILAPTGKTFDYVCTGRLHKIYVHFRLEYYPGRDVFEGLHDGVSASGSAEDFRLFAQRMGRGNLSDLVAAQGQILGWVLPFIRVDLKGSAKRMAVAEKYARMFAHIEEHPHPALSAPQLAPLTGLAPSTLVKRFRRDTGVPLSRYVHTRIAERAGEELLFSPCKVKDLARRLGFDDEFYFSRFFKKHHGLSPMEYRKQRRM